MNHKFKFIYCMKVYLAFVVLTHIFVDRRHGAGCVHRWN